MLHVEVLHDNLYLNWQHCNGINILRLFVNASIVYNLKQCLEGHSYSLQALRNHMILRNNEYLTITRSIFISQHRKH